jgi:hypothetical protein
MIKTQILPVLAGFIAASIIMMLFEFTNSRFFPFGDGFDTSNIDALRAFTAQYSPQLFYMVLAGWLAGAVCGGYITARFSEEQTVRTTGVLAALLALGGIINHVMFQHPTWFNILGFAALIGGTYGGWYMYQKRDTRSVYAGIIAGVSVIALSLTYAAYMSKPSIQQSAIHPDTSFFVTSVNPGRGADLGGLMGADAHCTQLATQAGISGKTWAAYLSTPQKGDVPAVHARDRIGAGPWKNTAGVIIAESVESLHGVNNLNKETARTERGMQVLGKGDKPNEHDILTGSTADGRAYEGETDTTCNGWTSSAEGSAFVGHHDRVGRDDSEPMKSWNAAHGSRGCSIEALRSTGGAGLYYCFAK